MHNKDFKFSLKQQLNAYPFLSMLMIIIWVSWILRFQKDACSSFVI